MGAKHLLEKRKINYIQFEFGEHNLVSRVFFRDFFDLLNDCYDIYRVLPRGLRKIKKYTTDLEVFDTIIYLAELKIMKHDSFH